MWWVLLGLGIFRKSEPTLRFAYGGSADFRGKNNTFFNILSAPNISLNMKTTDVLTLLPRPSLLNSSFFTEAFFTFRLNPSNKILRIGMFANETGYRIYHDDKIYLEKLGVWKDTQIESVRILSKKITNLIRANGWEINITKTLIDYPLEGQPTWRYNVRMTTLSLPSHLKMYGSTNFDQVAPHGILGQSFDNNKIAVEGRKTDYDSDYIDQKEQSEGSLEGVWNDYIMEKPFTIDYKYSRFSSIHSVPSRSVTLLNVVPYTKTNLLAEINDDLGKEDYKRKVQ